MKKFLAILFCASMAGGVYAKVYTVASPDSKTVVSIDADKALSWSIRHGDATVLAPSRIALTLADGKVLGENTKVTKTKQTSVNEVFPTPFYKKSEVNDRYNQLTIDFKGGYALQVRAYDNAAAYRFVTSHKGDIIIADETAEFNFPADCKAFVPYVNDNRGGDRWSFSFESYYDEQPISQMYADSLAITPLLVDLGANKKALIMEGGVENYPGMYLVKNPDLENSIMAKFPPVITKGHWGGYMDMNYVSDERAPYIATTGGKRTYPWRAVVISDNDASLLDNDMAQCLAQPSRIADVSWIKPGTVSWDWWNTTNLTDVDFRAGMNTDTYKHFIDFASEYGIPYIIIDAGWSGSRSDWKGETLMQCIPQIDLPAVIAHGNEKGVGVILWASWALTDKEKEVAFPHYAKMGVKGFKVDFLDRDDQDMMKSMWDIARCAAENNLLLDLHGMKPCGLQRTYPNVVNFEGVKGLENCKWAAMEGDRSRDDFLRYDVTIPYIRMAAGPMDYTPGAMNNASRHCFRPINDHPMSQGTRVHQLAMYVVYEAPLQMLADSPSAYRKNPDCTSFISSVPTVFDRTVALDGRVGEYVMLARNNGENWYLGALNNWDPRFLVVDFGFLPEGVCYEAEIFTDGFNADKEATDYRHTVTPVRHSTKLPMFMAPGGGVAIRLTPHK